MYKLHLILKYLRKRRIAWASLVAVMLCTTMVLVVISVMGGWLRTFRQTFHGMSGDVVIRSESVVGFPYYDEMMAAIARSPQLKGQIKAQSPVIRSFGLVNVWNRIRRPVQVVGLRNDIRRVNSFSDSLHLRKDPSSYPDLFSLIPGMDYDRYKPPKVQSDANQWPGMIVGSGLIGIRKLPNGELERPTEAMYHAWVRLTLLPIDPNSSTLDIKEKAEKEFWIVDDSRTQVSLIDAEAAYVSFDVLQQMLNMQARSYEDAITHQTRQEPARATEIQIALEPGTDLAAAKASIEKAVDAVAADNHMDTFRFPFRVETWQETHSKFLAQVEREKVLMTVLFGIISVVAVFLIFCIFYMIVMEKTRDIGIVKSVGASSNGVAGIFLGYGAVIGVLGSGMGLLAGWLIVHNINSLHAWLGRLMGVEIYSPDVYLFDSIPNTMNPNEVTVIIAVGIVASIVGAIWPAIRAAQMNPVEALRWE